MDYILYGAGGHARELLFQLRDERTEATVIGMVDDFKNGHVIEGVPVMDYQAARMRAPGARWIPAVGAVEARQELIRRLRADRIEPEGFISRRALIAPTASLGRHVQIFAFAVISDNAKIGDGVVINFSSVISHDVSVGRGTTIAPRVAIAGRVAIGEEAFIGVGAAIVDSSASRPITIGSRAVVGAGACVVASVDADCTVVGVPARPLREKH